MPWASHHCTPPELLPPGVWVLLTFATRLSRLGLHFRSDKTEHNTLHYTKITTFTLTLLLCLISPQYLTPLCLKQDSNCCQHALDTIIRLFLFKYINNITQHMQNNTAHITALLCFIEKPTNQSEETHWGCWSSQTRSHTWCRGRWLKPGANQNVAAFPVTNSTVRSQLRYCNLSYLVIYQLDQPGKPKFAYI